MHRLTMIFRFIFSALKLALVLPATVLAAVLVAPALLVWALFNVARRGDAPEAHDGMGSEKLV